MTDATDPSLHPVDDNPYLALSEIDDDSRWAFGGGFDDPLEGVDTTVPDGVDASALAALCLALGDESLLLAQTLQRWCTHAPELEEEVAIANVALDLIGQTRMLYARAAAAAPQLVPDLPEGSPVPDEDRLAFFRDAGDFRAGALAVMPDADFAGLMLRLAAVATWRDALWRELRSAPDPVLAAIAERAVAEVGYHRDLASRWVSVLAGGTAESARRLAAAHRLVAPLVRDLTALPPGVDADPAWGHVWSRAAAAFEDRWSATTAVEPVETPRGVSPRDGRSAPSSGQATGAADGDDEDVVRAWRAGLVVELQAVARQHPMGRW